MDHSHGGQYFLFLDLPLAFITKCMPTKWFEKSQLEASMIYFWKETVIQV